MLVSSGRRVLSVTRARLLSTVAVASMEDGSLRAHVSRRGREAPALLPRYLSDARGVETFDAVSRPDGVLQLSVAENQMISDWLVPRIRSIAASPASDAHGGGAGLFEQADIFYQQTHGTPQCRAAVAAHMERVLCGGSYPIDPDKLVVGAGCNAVLENLLFALADAGEGVLVPRPYYAAFEFDLRARAALEVLPVAIRRGGFEASGYYPTADALEARCAGRARSRPDLGQISARSRPDLGQISARSRPNLGQISARSRPHLGRTSAAPRPHLGRTHLGGLRVGAVSRHRPPRASALIAEQPSRLLLPGRGSGGREGESLHSSRLA